MTFFSNWFVIFFESRETKRNFSWKLWVVHNDIHLSLAYSFFGHFSLFVELSTGIRLFSSRTNSSGNCAQFAKMQVRYNRQFRIQHLLRITLAFFLAYIAIHHCSFFLFCFVFFALFCFSLFSHATIVLDYRLLVLLYWLNFFRVKLYS